MRAIPLVAVLAALLCFPGRGHDPAAFSGGCRWPAWGESAAADSGGYVTLRCPLLVYTTPSAIWEILTTVRSFSMWYPNWGPEENMLRELSAVGDTVTFFVQGEPAGRSVVTWFDPLRELRLVHEVAVGGDAGGIRMTLEPAEGGVGFTYEETLPSKGLDVSRERRRVCKQAVLIKRLAEGE